jgi:hypothetical protein
MVGKTTPETLELGLEEFDKMILFFQFMCYNGQKNATQAKLLVVQI